MERKTVIRGLGGALCGLLLSACHGALWNKPMQPDNFYEVGQQAGATESEPLSRQVSSFRGALDAARAEPTDAEKARTFSEHGIVLTNMLCYTYFREAAESRQRVRYKDTLTTNVSTVIGALLNLDGASHLATGAVTALSGGLSNDFKSQDVSFVPAPDLPTVKKLVSKAMDEQANQMRALKEPVYSDVSVRLIRLAESCDFTGIQALVQQSATEGVKNIKLDDSGNAMVSNVDLPETQYTRAKASQDSGFEYLEKCRWADAERAFLDAEKAYPRFQGSYEFWKALNTASGTNENKAAAVLAVPEDKAGAFMPREVRNSLSSRNRCPP